MGAGHAHALHVHGHSPVHRLAPEVKVVAAVGFVGVVAVTPPHVPLAFAGHLAVVVAVAALARLRPGFVVARAAVALPFLTFALLIPFVATGERTEVLGVAVSAEGLVAARTILAKALLGVTASVLLAATTELPAIMRGLARLRVPAPLTQIATFMVRYLETTAGELARMRTAMVARGHDPRWLWQARPLASSAGALFVRSFERGERIHAAMLSRGYDGTMPQVHAQPAVGWGWLAALAPAALAAASTALALR